MFLELPNPSAENLLPAEEHVKEEKEWQPEFGISPGLLEDSLQRTLASGPKNFSEIANSIFDEYEVPVGDKAKVVRQIQDRLDSMVSDGKFETESEKAKSGEEIPHAWKLKTEGINREVPLAAPADHESYQTIHPHNFAEHVTRSLTETQPNYQASEAPRLAAQGEVEPIRGPHTETAPESRKEFNTQDEAFNFLLSVLEQTRGLERREILEKATPENIEQVKQNLETYLEGNYPGEVKDMENPLGHLEHMLAAALALNLKTSLDNTATTEERILLNKKIKSLIEEVQDEVVSRGGAWDEAKNLNLARVIETASRTHEKPEATPPDNLPVVGTAKAERIMNEFQGRKSHSEEIKKQEPPKPLHQIIENNGQKLEKNQKISSDTLHEKQQNLAVAEREFRSLPKKDRERAETLFNTRSILISSLVKNYLEPEHVSTGETPEEKFITELRIRGLSEKAAETVFHLAIAKAEIPKSEISQEKQETKEHKSTEPRLNRESKSFLGKFFEKINVHDAVQGAVDRLTLWYGDKKLDKRIERKINAVSADREKTLSEIENAKNTAIRIDKELQYFPNILKNRGETLSPEKIRATGEEAVSWRAKAHALEIGALKDADGRLAKIKSEAEDRKDLVERARGRLDSKLTWKMEANNTALRALKESESKNASALNTCKEELDNLHTDIENLKKFKLDAASSVLREESEREIDARQGRLLQLTDAIGSLSDQSEKLVKQIAKFDSKNSRLKTQREKIGIDIKTKPTQNQEQPQPKNQTQIDKDSPATQYKLRRRKLEETITQPIS